MSNRSSSCNDCLCNCVLSKHMFSVHGIETFQLALLFQTVLIANYRISLFSWNCQVSSTNYLIIGNGCKNALGFIMQTGKRLAKKPGYLRNNIPKSVGSTQWNPLHLTRALLLLKTSTSIVIINTKKKQLYLALFGLMFCTKIW